LVRTGLKSRRNFFLKNLALRHQLLVLRRSSNRPPLTPPTRPGPVGVALSGLLEDRQAMLPATPAPETHQI
jgi:hypothetical protein